MYVTTTQHTRAAAAAPQVGNRSSRQQRAPTQQVLSSALPCPVLVTQPQQPQQLTIHTPDSCMSCISTYIMYVAAQAHLIRTTLLRECVLLCHTAAESTATKQRCLAHCCAQSQHNICWYWHAPTQPQPIPLVARLQQAAVLLHRSQHVKRLHPTSAFKEGLLLQAKNHYLQSPPYAASCHQHSDSVASCTEQTPPLLNHALWPTHRLPSGYHWGTDTHLKDTSGSGLSTKRSPNTASSAQLGATQNLSSAPPVCKVVPTAEGQKTCGDRRQQNQRHDTHWQAPTMQPCCTTPHSTQGTCHALTHLWPSASLAKHMLAQLRHR